MRELLKAMPLVVLMVVGSAMLVVVVASMKFHDFSSFDLLQLSSFTPRQASGFDGWRGRFVRKDQILGQAFAQAIKPIEADMSEMARAIESEQKEIAGLEHDAEQKASSSLANGGLSGAVASVASAPLSMSSLSAAHKPVSVHPRYQHLLAKLSLLNKIKRQLEHATAQSSMLVPKRLDDKREDKKELEQDDAAVDKLAAAAGLMLKKGGRGGRGGTSRAADAGQDDDASDDELDKLARQQANRLRLAESLPRRSELALLDNSRRSLVANLKRLEQSSHVQPPAKRARSALNKHHSHRTARELEKAMHQDEAAYARTQKEVGSAQKELNSQSRATLKQHQLEHAAELHLKPTAADAFATRQINWDKHDMIRTRQLGMKEDALYRKAGIEEERLNADVASMLKRELANSRKLEKREKKQVIKAVGGGGGVASKHSPGGLEVEKQEAMERVAGERERERQREAAKTLRERARRKRRALRARERNKLLSLRDRESSSAQTLTAPANATPMILIDTRGRVGARGGRGGRHSGRHSSLRVSSVEKLQEEDKMREERARGVLLGDAARASFRSRLLHLEGDLSGLERSVRKAEAMEVEAKEAGILKGGTSHLSFQVAADLAREHQEKGEVQAMRRAKAREAAAVRVAARHVQQDNALIHQLKRESTDTKAATLLF